MNQRKIITAKFFGTLLCLFLFPCYLTIFFNPIYVKVLVGVLAPLTGLAIWCFASGRYEFSQLLTQKVAWVFALSLLLIGAANLFVYGSKYSTGWFVSSFVFFMFTYAFYSILVFCNLVTPPEGKDWK